ncbi:Cell division cycle-related protein res2/pct1 [Termitomyces sp. J132]|nr:Cell division cycle-related protein res2/pct1 [Termitomyces sp. J132]
MQAGPRPPGSTQPPVKIYNAVYSSVQVYECMVRGIVVMRRRSDSYVNATQILKVGGVDKGRRTKILKKKILPGKHDSPGWPRIPLANGRAIAEQYGVAPLLSPLFDLTPSIRSLSTLSFGDRQLHLLNALRPGGPPPILPGSALQLLNQGRAHGLFTLSTSDLSPSASGFASPSFSGYDMTTMIQSLSTDFHLSIYL